MVEAAATRAPLLSIAAERQVWHRSAAASGGERTPAGRLHAVFGKEVHTLCGLPWAELAQFPYLDFVAPLSSSAMYRCDVCQRRGAAILH